MYLVTLYLYFESEVVIMNHALNIYFKDSTTEIEIKGRILNAILESMNGINNALPDLFQIKDITSELGQLKSNMILAQISNICNSIMDIFRVENVINKYCDSKTLDDLKRSLVVEITNEDVRIDYPSISGIIDNTCNFEKDYTESNKFFMYFHNENVFGNDMI